MKLDIPISYKAFAKVPRTRNQKWVDVRTTIPGEIAEIGRSDVDREIPIAGWSVLPGYWFQIRDWEPIAVVRRGRLYLPLVSSSTQGAFGRKGIPTMAGMMPSVVHDLVRPLKAGGPDPRILVGVNGFGISALERSNHEALVLDETILSSVEHSGREVAIERSRRHADEMLVVEGMVYSAALEPVRCIDSSGKPASRLLSVVDYADTLGTLDLEWDALRTDKAHAVGLQLDGPDFHADGEIECRFDDVAASSVLGLRRCLRSVFTRNDGASAVGNGVPYVGSLPDEFEDAITRMRKAMRKVSVLAGGDSLAAAAVARGEIAAFTELLARTGPPLLEWDESVKRRRIGEMTIALQRWDEVHAPWIARKAMEASVAKLRDEDEGALLAL